MKRDFVNFNKFHRIVNNPHDHCQLRIRRNGGVYVEGGKRKKARDMHFISLEIRYQNMIRFLDEFF